MPWRLVVGVGLCVVLMVVLAILGGVIVEGVARLLARFSHRRAPEERNRAWAGPQMLGARPKAP